MEEKRPLTVPENAGDAPQQEAAEYEERPGAQQPLTDAAENAPAQPDSAAPTGKKARRAPQALFVRRDTLEWMGTLAASALILYAGYLLGEAAQAGYTGAALLRQAFTGWYPIVYAVLLAVYAVVCNTLAKKGLRWLAAPAAVHLGLTVYKLYQPCSVLAALITAGLRGSANAPVMAKKLALPLAAVLVPYVLQLAALISLIVLVCGRGSRIAHGVLCVVWTAAAVTGSLLYLSGGLRENAPRLMLALAFIAVGLLAMLPAGCGRRVPLQELDALREEDAHAAAQKKKRGARAADRTGEEVLSEPDAETAAEAESTADALETAEKEVVVEEAAVEQPAAQPAVEETVEAAEAAGPEESPAP